LSLARFRGTDKNEFLDQRQLHGHVFELLSGAMPKTAASNLVNSLKWVPSGMIPQKKYPTIRKKLWGEALWPPSYFDGSCGGAPSPSFANTSNNRRRAEASLARRALHLRPEGRVFPRY
jgi:hypothetical protein